MFRGKNKVISLFLVLTLLVTTLFIMDAHVAFAVSGIDLAPSYSSGSTTGTVGTSMPITICMYNYGDTPTPNGTKIYVEFKVDGVLQFTQPYLPHTPDVQYCFGPNGWPYYYEGMTFYWTPSTEGSHTLTYKVLYDNYTDVNTTNNTLTVNVTVTDPRKNLYSTPPSSGVDLALRYSSGSTSGNVGQAMTITMCTFNYGDTATPNGTNITVEMYDNGEKKLTQQYTPGNPPSYCFGAYGQAYYYSGMNFTWTPTKDGVHLLDFKVVYDNYTDVRKENNFLVIPVTVTESSNSVKDTVDFGNSTSESSHSIASSGGGTGSYTETIGNVQDSYDARYTGTSGSWFSASVSNTANKYGTLAIRENHQTVSTTYRRVLDNYDQYGTGSNGQPVNIEGSQGQTFTTGPNTTYISSVALQVEKVGLLSGSFLYGKMIVNIYESPSKNMLLASTYKMSQDIQGGYAWEVFDFEEDVAVLPNTQYYFEISTSFGYDINNRFLVWRYSTSTYTGGCWYYYGTAMTGQTMVFKTGPDITTTYDVLVNDQVVGAVDQETTGSGFLPRDIFSDTNLKEGQSFTVDKMTEIQSIAVALEKAGTIPANNAVKLTLYDTPISTTANYLATNPWDMPILAEAILAPGQIPGGYNYATFVFPGKVSVYPGRRYYFELSTVLPYDANNRYVAKVFESSNYANRGDYYWGRVKQASGQAISFKVGANPTFNTRSLCDKGNGALTYYVDLPQTYSGSSITVKIINRNNHQLYIDKLLYYTGFNSYASRYDTPLNYMMFCTRDTENFDDCFVDVQAGVIKANVIERSDTYLGGNEIKKGFVVDNNYAKWSNTDPSVETSKIINIAKQYNMPWSMYLNSTWSGSPREFYGARFDQIMYSNTDNYSDPDMDTLPQRLAYSSNTYYGRTIPLNYGQLPWQTYNSGGFTNPVEGTLNGLRLNKISSAVSDLNDRLLDIASQSYDAPFLSADNEPAYWGYQMREVDGNPYTGYPTVNGGNMRILPTGDFGPDAFDQAAADGVTLNPADGLSDTELNWLHKNLTNYNNFIYSNIHSKLNKGITTVNNNSKAYPATALKYDEYTQNFIYLRFSISRDRPCYEPAFQNTARPGFEASHYTRDIPIIDRMVSNSGTTGNMNQETTGFDSDYYFPLCQNMFKTGPKNIVPFNAVKARGGVYSINDALTNVWNNFTGDPIRMGSLIDMRRKYLTTSAERDAWKLKNEISPKILSGDALAQPYLIAANNAYNSGDFKAAYQNYIAAECAAKSILPAPFVVSGSQGTLDPYSLKVTSVSGGKANIIITENVTTSPYKLSFSSVSTITGSVSYAVTSPFDSTYDVWVNGTPATHSHGAEITFSVSQTAGTKYNIVIAQSAPSTPTPTPTPAPPSYAGGNVASRTTVAASSSYEGKDWSTVNVVDGRRNSWYGSNGWSSSSNLTINHTEWVKIDLDQSYTLRRIDLWPRNADVTNDGYGFPIDFTIEVSTDNINWTTVANRTGYPKPLGCPQGFSFTPQSVRYIKVTGTNLRQNPNDNNCYKMQFAEIEAIRN